MSGSIYSGTLSPQTCRAGVATLEVGGVAVDVAGELTYDATSVKRELLIGQSGVQGYSEMPKPGFISASLRDSGAMSQAAFMSQGPVSIVAVLANGKVVSGDYLIATETGNVNTTEGTFEVKWEGFVLESSS